MIIWIILIVHLLFTNGSNGKPAINYSRCTQMVVMGFVGDGGNM